MTTTVTVDKPQSPTGTLYVVIRGGCCGGVLYSVARLHLGAWWAVSPTDDQAAMIQAAFTEQPAQDQLYIEVTP